MRYFIALLALVSVTAHGAKEPSIQEARCFAALIGVPHLDVIEDWRIRDLPKRADQLKSVNARLPVELQFTPDQLDTLLTRFVHAPPNDWYQLKDLSEETPQSITQMAAAVRKFFDLVMSYEIPSENEVIHFNTEHHPFSGLNPIQIYRRENLRAQIAELEKEVGQPLVTEEELNHAAQQDYLAENLVERLKIYTQLKPPIFMSIVETKKLLFDIGKIAAPEPMGIGVQYDAVTAFLVMKNDPELNSEVRFYASLSGGIGWSFGEFIIRRLNSLLNGKIDFVDSVNFLLAQDIRKEIETVVKVDPTIMDGFQHRTISRTFAAQKQVMGKENFEREMSSLRWRQAKLTYIGRWNLADIPQVLGIVLSPVAAQKAYEVFSLDVPFKEGVKHFAILTRITWGSNEDSSYDRIRFNDFEGIEILNIRETQTTARFQDAFFTFPIDLRDPLVELVNSEGSPIFAKPPNQIVIERVEPEGSEVDEKAWSKVEGLHSFADAVNDVFSGSPKGPYAAIRLFNNDYQVGNSKHFLALTSSGGGKQVYESDANLGVGRSAHLKLVRNLITGAYTLEVQTAIGFGAFKITVGTWRGEFRPPQE